MERLEVREELGKLPRSDLSLILQLWRMASLPGVCFTVRSY